MELAYHPNPRDTLGLGAKLRPSTQNYLLPLSTWISNRIFEPMNMKAVKVAGTVLPATFERAPFKNPLMMQLGPGELIP